MTLKGIFKLFSKINYTKVLIFVFFFVMWLLWAVINTQAQTAQQTNDSILSPYESDAGGNILRLGTGWNIGTYSYEFTYNTTSSVNYLTAHARFGTQGFYFSLPDIDPTTSTIIYQDGSKITKKFTFVFNASNSSTTQELWINHYQGSDTYNWRAYGTSTIIYSYCDTWGQYISPCNQMASFGTPKFILYSASSSYINITYPNNNLSTPDFNAFHIDYTFSTSTLIYAGHSVKYSQNLSQCVAYNNGSGCYMDFEPTHNQNEIYAPIIKLNNLPIGNYQAQANLYNNDVVVATSSIINFYITGQPAISSLFEMPTSTWATSTLAIQITCDPNDNFFQYSLCKLLTYLFVPDSNTLNKYSTLTSGISTKVPIGYFTSVSALISQFSSSTPAFALGIDENDPTNTTFFDPIRTGLIWILWLAFAFWLFHRFRHFSFTSP